MLTKLEDINNLKDIAVGTQNGAYAFKKLEDITTLVEQGLIEYNATVKNEAGEVVCRVTETGDALFLELTTPKVTPESFFAAGPVASAPLPATAVEGDESPAKKARAYVEKANITIDQGVPLIPISRSTSRSSKYNFEGMQIGESFFLEQPKDAPAIQRAVGSAVSAANKRVLGKKFVQRQTPSDPVTGLAGVRVYCLSPETITERAVPQKVVAE